MAKAKDYSNGVGAVSSLQQDTADLFGKPAPASASTENDELRRGRRERVEQINILDIQPDLTQPRRVLPSIIRAGWDGQPASLMTLFNDWRAWAKQENWLTLIDAVLDGEEVERPDDVPAEFAALLEIASLAASIRRDGLMNPVTLAKLPDNRYQIESGERRWLAYHLLYATTNETQWQQIPARLVGEVNRWRQAAENNTRADLNAIGKARQFAVLLMDLLTAEGEQFAGFDQFQNEQDFYAQVADGESCRIPRGKGELLLTAMGLKNAQQLRGYRALLRLPSDLWREADDENWTEARVRRLMGDGNSDTVSTDTVSIELTDSPTAEDVPSGEKKSGGKPTKKVFVIPEKKRLPLVRLASLSEDTFDDTRMDQDRLNDIREARAALDELERTILSRKR